MTRAKLKGDRMKLGLKLAAGAATGLFAAAPALANNAAAAAEAAAPAAAAAVTPTL